MRSGRDAGRDRQRLDGVQLGRNALTGGGRYAVAALLGFLVTPYALGVLGRDRFGLWALAGALLAALQLADLGLGRALVRSVADATGRGDPAAAEPLLATGRGIAAMLAPAMVLAAWLARHWLVTTLLRVPPELSAEAVYVVVGVAVAAALRLWYLPYQAGLDGIGRMDISNGIDTAQRLVSAFGTVAVLALGLGLVGLVWKSVVVTGLAGLAYRRLLRARQPELGSVPVDLAWGHARGLLAFGRHIQAVNLGSILIEPVSKGLLARSVGLDAVALFELAWRVTGMVSSAFVSLAAALFPAAAELKAASCRSSDEALAALHRRATRYLGWLALPAYALLTALARPFVSAWLGEGYGPAALAIVVLAPAWLLAILSTPAFVVAQASGRERLSTMAGLVTAGTAIGLSAVLVGPAGMDGVVVAVALGLACGGVAVLALFARELLPTPRSALPLGWREATATLACAGLAWTSAAAMPAGLTTVALSALTGVAAYFALLHVLGAVDAADRAYLWRLVRMAGPADGV